jgi:hypothetical protein
MDKFYSLTQPNPIAGSRYLLQGHLWHLFIFLLPCCKPDDFISLDFAICHTLVLFPVILCLPSSLQSECLATWLLGVGVLLILLPPQQPSHRLRPQHGLSGLLLSGRVIWRWVVTEGTIHTSSTPRWRCRAWFLSEFHACFSNPGRVGVGGGQRESLSSGLGWWHTTVIIMSPALLWDSAMSLQTAALACMAG